MTSTPGPSAGTPPRTDGLLDVLDRARQDELLQMRNDLMTVYREFSCTDPRLFPLRYTRTGIGRARPGVPPVLVIPGGPGTASVIPYEALRRRLAARGLSSVMVEHRGVGLSRLDSTGRDLPAHAMTVEGAVGDLIAVLEHARIPQAVVLGSGYGAYLAQILAAQRPDLVHSLVLDSPLTSAEDEACSQRALRARYWDGSVERTESIARTLRRLVHLSVLDGSRAGPILLRVHDVGGTEAVRELVDLLALDRGRLTWNSVRQTLTQEWLQSTPYFFEQDLVGHLAHTRLGQGAHADGGPMDPLQLAAARARAVAPFTGEEYDVHELSRQITAPTLVLSGSEDLVIPPEISRALVDRIPGASLLTLPGVGHSLLDTHSPIAEVAVRWSAAGAAHLLPERAQELVTLPRTPANWAFLTGIRTALAVERVSPWRLWVESARGRRAGALADPTRRRVRHVRQE